MEVIATLLHEENLPLLAQGAACGNHAGHHAQLFAH